MADALPRERRALAVAVGELRARRRMTQEDLAQAAGVSRGYIYDLEDGRRRTSFEAIVCVARALRVPLDEFFELFEARLRDTPPEVRVALGRPRIGRALTVCVRELRARERISQEALSLEAGLGRGFVGDLECGRRRASFESVVLIADALDIPVSELAERFEAAVRRDQNG